MGQQQQVAVLHLAPRTRVPVAQLHKIDRPVKFRAPPQRLDFPNVRIDLHKRTRPQQWRERVVLQSDVPVQAMADVQMLDQCDRDFSPNFNHARQQVGVVHVEGPVEAHRKRNGLFCIVDFQRRQMGIGKRRGHLVLDQILQIHAVEEQQVAELDAVNRTQAVKLENARDGVRILDLCQPGVGNVVFGVIFGLRDFVTKFGNVAGGNSQAVTNIFELFAGRESKGHGVFYNTRQLNCQSVPATIRLDLNRYDAQTQQTFQAWDLPSSRAFWYTPPAVARR